MGRQRRSRHHNYKPKPVPVTSIEKNKDSVEAICIANDLIHECLNSSFDVISLEELAKKVTNNDMITSIDLNESLKEYDNSTLLLDYTEKEQMIGNIIDLCITTALDSVLLFNKWDVKLHDQPSDNNESAKLKLVKTTIWQIQECRKDVFNLKNLIIEQDLHICDINFEGLLKIQALEFEKQTLTEILKLKEKSNDNIKRLTKMKNIEKNFQRHEKELKDRLKIIREVVQDSRYKVLLGETAYEQIYNKFQCNKNLIWDSMEQQVMLKREIRRANRVADMNEVKYNLVMFSARTELKLRIIQDEESIYQWEAGVRACEEDIKRNRSVLHYLQKKTKILRARCNMIFSKRLKAQTEIDPKLTTE